MLSRSIVQSTTGAWTRARSSLLLSKNKVQPGLLKLQGDQKAPLKRNPYLEPQHQPQKNTKMKKDSCVGLHVTEPRGHKRAKSGPSAARSKVTLARKPGTKPHIYHEGKGSVYDYTQIPFHNCCSRLRHDLFTEFFSTAKDADAKSAHISQGCCTLPTRLQVYCPKKTHQRKQHCCPQCCPNPARYFCNLTDGGPKAI